jgi:hypothetical protein
MSIQTTALWALLDVIADPARCRIALQEIESRVERARTALHARDDREADLTGEPKRAVCSEVARTGFPTTTGPSEIEVLLEEEPAEIEFPEADEHLCRG